MTKLTATDPETKSPDLVAENLARLKALFPELVTEGKDGAAVNVDVLKQLVGDRTVTDSEEKYGLNWHGKRRARQLALTPSTGTLRPCPEDSVDWDTTQNLMIEGDNLEVLKLLQKSYAGKVKLIYIDPPYNTGKDFVYPDNFQDNIRNYLELTGQTGEGGRKLSSNTEASGRFHTDWLNMMYPRLKLARNLLRDDGVIFISIDDAEVNNLRKLCDDVFGEENFLAIFVRRRRMATGMRETPVSPDHEYVVSFAKSLPEVGLYGFARRESDFPFEDNRSRFRSTDLTVGMTKEMRPNQFYAIRNPRTGSEYWPPEERVWRFEPTTMQTHLGENIIWPDENPSGRMSRPRFKTRFESGADGEKTNPVSTWVDLKVRSDDPESEDAISLTAGLNQEATKELRELFGEQLLEYPKPVSLLRALCAVGSKSEGVILDFFAGSGTTGHAVWDLNKLDGGTRRFVLVQIPEPTNHTAYPTIAEITKERLRRAGKRIREENPLFAGDLGFRVFKLDSSNIQAWDPDRADLAASLEAHAKNLKVDRTEQDILFELLLKLGLDLTVPIVQRTLAGKTVHSIGGGVLLVCLAESISRADAETLALGLIAWHKEQAPTTEDKNARNTVCVFRDSAFADDVAKTNLAAILQQHGLETVRSL